jgi:hypothetical protein
MKVPSPEWWRRFEVAGVDDDGYFSKMLRRFIEIAGVDDEGSEKVR